MSKGGGGSSNQTVKQTTTSNANPWVGAQPYIKGGLSDLSKWYQSGYGRDPYPGSSVVPFSPFTEQALGMTANRAIQGSDVNRNASSMLAKTLHGDYLSPETNPWLKDTYDLAAGQMRSQLDSQFNKGGYGGSLHEGARASQLGDLGTKLYGGAYDAERSRMMQGLALAPTIANQEYFDSSQLAGVGQAYEKQAGAYLQDSINRYNFYQNEPYERLTKLFQIVNPASGFGSSGSSSTTGPKNSGSGLTDVLGGLSSAAGLANTLGLFGSGAAAASSFIPSAAAATALNAGGLSAGMEGVMAGLAAFSDPEMKENIEPAENMILDLFKQVPGFIYDYKKKLGPAFAGRKVGPMADAFASAFGGDGHTIPMPKMLGAIWSAIPALINKVERLEARTA